MDSFDIIVGCNFIKVEQFDGPNILTEKIHRPEMQHLLAELCHLCGLVYSLIGDGAFLRLKQLGLRLLLFLVLNT